MALNIESRETERVVRELAKRTNALVDDDGPLIAAVTL